MVKSFLNILLFTWLALLAFGRTASAAPITDESVYHIANQIRKEIVKLPTYGLFDFLSFSIADGTAGVRVQLKGYASRPILKSAAENAVKKVEAVESVDNQIEVLPTSGNDDDIRFSAYASIYGHSWLSRYNPNRGTPIYGLRRRAFLGISNDPPIGPHPIRIIVKNGNIILEGVVDTEGDKNIAGIQARTVSGAFSVTNNLIVPRKEQ